MGGAVTTRRPVRTYRRPATTVQAVEVTRENRAEVAAWLTSIGFPSTATEHGYIAIGTESLTGALGNAYPTDWVVCEAGQTYPEVLSDFEFGQSGYKLARAKG